MIVLLLVLPTHAVSTVQKPIRLAVAGMSHGHISFILGRADKKDFEIVGIWESNNDLVKIRTKEFNLLGLNSTPLAAKSKICNPS